MKDAPRRTVAMMRRLLLSRRFAMTLLALLWATVVAGSLIPQAARLDPLVYAQWRDQNPTFAGWVERTGFDHVYSSAWFWALVALMALTLLYVSLYRAYLLLRHRAMSPDAAGMMAYEHQAAFPVRVAPADVLDCAQRALAKRGYRTTGAEVDSGLAIFGTKGGPGRWGSIVFHLSLVVVLAGGVIAATGGSVGTMVITEGQSLRDRAEDYLLAPEKRWASGFSDALLRLDNLSLDYYDGGDLSNAEARFTVTRDGREEQVTARVNEPVDEAGARYVLDRYGFAPLFVLKDAEGRERFRSYVNLSVRQTGEVDSFRVPGTSLEVSVQLYPDAVLSETTGEPVASRSQRPDHPVAYVALFDGQRELFHGPVALQGVASWDGGSLSFAGLRYWTQLRVVKSPGEPVLFAGFWLGIIGLVLRFGLIERRVAVRIAPEATGILVRVAGHAEQCRALYAEEFAGVVAAIAGELNLDRQRDSLLLGDRSTISG